MSGWFRQLFAPRWQHPDPERRRQAAGQLDPAQDEGRAALIRLAGDADARVRQAALARLESIDTLLALVDTHPSPELRARLAALLVGAAGSTPLDDRVAWVATLCDQGLIQEVALHGDNQQLRLAAVAALRDDDEAALIAQACENGIAAVRHAAAARVTSEAGLQQLARQARRDKQVARLARERLNALRADAAQQAAAEAERERILSALEQHGHHAWEPLYAGRYRHLQREWEALKDLPSAEQERRYHDACLLCRKTLTDHDAQQHVHAAFDQRREDADQTREGLLEALEETLESLRRSEHLAAQDIDSLRAQKRLLATRWQALSDHHAPDETLRQRYDRALEEYDRIGHAWERFRARAAELDQALTACDREALQALLTACAWPDDLPPTSLLARARRSAEQQPAARSVPDPSQFQRDVDELGVLLERGAFKSASRLHQRLRQRLEQLPEEHRRRHQPTLKRLGAQLAELRDWRGFVAGPKRDQLCQAIAELAEDTQLSDAALDRRHRQLVKEWASLGDAAADRELSAHFRACSDRIHQRLAAWRAALDAERQRNLEAREALCEQLEALLDKPDPEADPDALRDIRDRAREQWRRYSPVPRERAEAVGRRFGRVRHGLQALIDQRAQAIAAAKRELTDAAQALLDSDQPSHRRAEQAKRLQQRWRDLGRAPKGEEQALWREFRSICDRIFANREAERNDRTERARQQLDAMQALIDRLDGWQPATLEDAATLDAAIVEAEALEPLPAGRRSDGMRRRWSGIVRARRERLARLAVCEEVSRWQALQPLLNTHLAADDAVLNGQPAGDVEADDSLGGDLLSAHRLRNARRREPPPQAEVEESLARLRVHLALLAGSRVGQQDDPLRLAIQVERLNEGLGRELSKAEELHEVLRELFATGPVSGELWQREAQELDAIFAQLLRLPPP